MPVAVLLRQLRLLALQVSDLALQLLDVFVAEHRRERVHGRRALHRLQLAVQRFLFDAHRLGLRDRTIEVRQPLDDDVLPVLDGDGVVRLLVALELRPRVSSTFFRCSASCVPNQSVASFEAENRASRFCWMYACAMPLAMSEASCGSDDVTRSSTIRLLRTGTTLSEPRTKPT